MATMTVADMRDYCRDYLDTDSTELPDSILDVWRDEGTSRIQKTFEPWSFYESTWTLITSDHAATLADDVDVVKSVEGDNYLLRYRPHESMIKKYAWGDVSGTPIEWSIWAGTLYLWPTPEESADYTVVGIRKPTDATDASDTVDLPAEFHPIICEFMLSRAYEQQDDTEMSQQKLGSFEQFVDGYRRRYLRASAAGVQVVGSQCSDDYQMSLSQMRWDWEI